MYQVNESGIIGGTDLPKARDQQKRVVQCTAIAKQRKRTLLLYLNLWLGCFLAGISCCLGRSNTKNFCRRLELSSKGMMSSCTVPVTTLRSVPRIGYVSL